MKKSKISAFTLIELLVVISIIAILAGIALPVFGSVAEKGAQTKDLSNAKQIGLACKLYAVDNDGQYPNKDVAGLAIPPGSDANQYYKALFPAYITKENIFFVPKSVWNTIGGIVTPPDEDISLPTTTLIRGENQYAYVPNLTDSSNPNFPLVADGFIRGTVGKYSIDPLVEGGLWKGTKAIVIRCDQSGVVEKVNAGGLVMGKTGAATPADIFATGAAGWLTTAQAPANPL